jgi:tetratricopeptide (TPR) repeat protein
MSNEAQKLLTEFLSSISERLHVYLTTTANEQPTIATLDELHFLLQSNCGVRALRSAVGMLQKCDSDAPPCHLADLIEAIEKCELRIIGAETDIPMLARAAKDKPNDGEAQAALGFALTVLDEWDTALLCFREALKHANTDALCFRCHRDSLNNLGWYSYLHGRYNEAVTWFEQACWMGPDPEDEKIHGITQDELQPPYRLAFENILLCLAKTGRQAEAADRLKEYHRLVGRLPLYETRALLKCGIDADVEYINSRIRDQR